MPTASSRSEEVIADFRQHKLAISALYRIQELIDGFEKDRAFDSRIAKIGIIAMLVLLAVSAFSLFGGGSLILS